MAKAMKAMKAMAAMKAMRAMKKKAISARTAVRQSHESHEGNGRHESHACYEEEGHLSKNRCSPSLRRKDRQDQGWLDCRFLDQEQAWTRREQEEVLERKELKIKGFCAVKKGTEFYKKAKSFM